MSRGLVPRLFMNEILSSDWTGLSPFLLAKFYRVTADENRVWARAEGPEVQAPLMESNLEVSLTWQSPFEQSGPDSKAPALVAMLQSGALQSVFTMLSSSDKDREAAAQNVDKRRSDTDTFLKSFEGRTGITKLNSTQIFTGMPPVKIQVTALFRAFSDARREVELPFVQLMQWALPQKLAPDGTLTNLVSAVRGSGGAAGVLRTLLPSLAPVVLGFEYKRRSYMPVVIETIGEPLSSPITSDGYYSELVVPLTISSLTALDRDDYARIVGLNSQTTN